MEINAFNIRVYGILIQNNKVLISHENWDGFAFTKFPGGGVEFGEGLEDGLKREFLEELNIEIQLSKLIYVNTHLVQSRFKKNEQLIAFYFLVESNSMVVPKSVEEIKHGKPFSITQQFVLKDDLTKVNFEFPLDREVVKKIGS